jgi:hypothetical protein
MPDEVRRYLRTRFEDMTVGDIYSYGLLYSRYGESEPMFRAAVCLGVIFYLGNPAKSEPLDFALLGDAKRAIARRGSLPRDWPDWFPQAVIMKLGIKTNRVMAADVYRYAVLRTLDADATACLEAAQCLAMLHHLGNPANTDVVVAVSPD